MPTNITFDDRDTTHLIYSPPNGWFLGTYNATSVGQTGTLATSKLTNGLNVSFLFPVPATDFYYFGIKRCCGGLYSICIDCDPINPKPITIDGVDPTDNGQNPPVVLFSRHFTVPGIHAVALANTDDQRFGGNSQITLSSFVITVPDTDTSTTGTSSSSSTPASTSGGATASASPSSSPSSSNLPGIIGGVLGGLAFLLIVAGTWFWCWRRSRRSPTLSGGQAELGPPPHQTAAPLDQNNNVTSPATATTMSLVSSAAVSTSQWTTTTSSAAPRRERDAGRIDPTSDDSDTLPPEYGQVFGSRSRRTSRQPSSPSTSGAESPPLRPMRRSKR